VDIFIQISLILVGFVALAKGANWLLKGGVGLAKAFKISELATGITVIAIGTSMPELVINVVSSYYMHDEMVFGNIIGSNIFNLYFILGIVGIFKVLRVRKKAVFRELPFALFSFLLTFIFVNDALFKDEQKNILNTYEAGIMLIMYVVFIFYVLKTLKQETNIAEEITQQNIKKKLIALYLVTGGVGLGIGGELIVTNASKLALHFNVSKQLISLTILAAGTSLPELSTSIVAAFKNKIDIAIGNIIGSNIVNVLLILPLSCVLHELEYDTAMNFDFNVMLLGTLLFLVSIFTSHAYKLMKWEAVIYVLFYIGYIYFLIVRG
jgi:cation:H+ antiporter